MPVRAFHRLHPVRRFHGGLPLKPQPPKPLRGFPPIPTRCTARHKENAARRPVAAATRQPWCSCSASRQGSSPDDSRVAGSASIIGGPPLPLKAQHFRRVFLICRAVHRSPFGGAPLNPRPPKPLRGSPPVPSTAGGCRLGASAAAGVRPPPSSSFVLPRLQAQTQQGRGYAPLRRGPAGSAISLLLSVRPLSSSSPSSVLAADAPTTPPAVPRFIRCSVPTHRPPIFGAVLFRPSFHAARLIKNHKKA